MTKKLEVYKCEVCGNIVEVLHEGKGELVCCKEKMKLIVENTVDASKEKHVPVIEKSAGGVTVKIGSDPHPMEEKHYIEWVAVETDGNVYRHFMKPGDVPKVKFPMDITGLAARAFCNIHGLWKA